MIEKIIVLGVSITLLSILLFNYFQNKTTLSAIVFLVSLLGFLSFYLLRFNHFNRNMMSDKSIVIQILTFFITCILAVSAVYSAHISNKISKLNSDDYRNRMKVQIFSRIFEIPKIEDRFKVKMLVRNNSNTDTNIENIDVVVIDFIKYLDNEMIDSLKAVQIEFEKLYLPSKGETTYSFNFHEKELIKLTNHSIAFLTAIRYTDYNNELRVHKMILKANDKFDKTNLGVYRSWIEDYSN